MCGPPDDVDDVVRIGMTVPHLDPGAHPWVQRILRPILHDLAATCAVPFEIRHVSCERRALALEASFTVSVPRGQEARVTFLGTGNPHQDIADLADTMQDIAADALWFERLSDAWPECPEHPGSHALRATVLGERAVWRCPLAVEVIAEIGRLPGRAAQGGDA